MSFAVMPNPRASMQTASEGLMRESWEENTRECGERLRNILRRIHPQGTAKMVARDADVPMRTVERILDGTSVPSFETMVRLFAAYPRLLEALEPVAAWAAVAWSAVEMDALDRQRADLAERRRRQSAATRSLR